MSKIKSATAFGVHGTWCYLVQLQTLSICNRKRRPRNNLPNSLRSRQKLEVVITKNCGLYLIVTEAH